MTRSPENPADPADPLHAYISKVLELLTTDNQPAPTPGELAAVARQLGLTTEDEARLLRVGEEALARGLGYLEHGRPDDACAELETAAALRPHDVETLHALAAARAARAVTADDADDDRRARQLVRRTLDLDPRHKPSFELLNRLDRQRPGGRRAPPPGRDRRLLLALGAALLVLVAVVLVLVFSAAPKPAPTRVAEEAASAETGEGDETIPAERLFPASVPPSLAVAGQGRQPAAIELDPEAAGRGLSAEIKDAWFNRYPERTYINAWILFENTSPGLVTTLKVEAQYLDAQGKTLKSQMHFPVISTAEPMRPGDTAPVRIISEVPAECVGAKLRIAELETRPYTAGDPDKAVELKWLVTKPAGVELSAVERSVEQFKHNEGGFWHKVVLAVSNKGTTPLRALTFNIMRYDGHDELRQADAVNVSWRHEMPLFVGETRVISSLESMPVQISRYAVQIVGATVDDGSAKSP